LQLCSCFYVAAVVCLFVLICFIFFLLFFHLLITSLHRILLASGYLASNELYWVID
jgi:hypothetical protein